MKVVGHLNAVAAVRDKLEEYAPEKGANTADIVALVRSAYAFHTFPNPAPGEPPPSTLGFMSGRFGEGDESFAIAHLLMEPGGDIVMTTTTDQADQVLDDLGRRLDRDLGFRLDRSGKKKTYVSNLVVQFDSGFEGDLEKISQIIFAINKTRPGLPPVGLKRLAFGTPTLGAAPDQIATLEVTDFVIERRVGSTFEENRYYSSAPLRTAEHIRVLAEIEAIILGRTA